MGSSAFWMLIIITIASTYDDSLCAGLQVIATHASVEAPDSPVTNVAGAVIIPAVQRGEMHGLRPSCCQVTAIH